MNKRQKMDKIGESADKLSELIKDTAIMHCTDSDGIPQERVNEIYASMNGIKKQLVIFLRYNNGKIEK